MLVVGFEVIVTEFTAQNDTDSRYDGEDVKRVSKRQTGQVVELVEGKSVLFV